MKTRLFQFFGVAAIAAIGLSSCETDPCDGVECGTNGDCLDGECVCADGFGGEDCSIDYCAELTCDATGGTKVATDGGCDCECNTGYEGEDCATEIRAKLIGSYFVSDNCSGSGSSTYTITAANSSSNVSAILISNFWDAFTNNVVASVTDGTITIANQDPDNDGYTVSGSGTYTVTGNIVTISLNYTVNDGTNSDVCQATMTKQ